MIKWSVPKSEKRPASQILFERDRCLDILKELEFYKENYKFLVPSFNWKEQLVIWMDEYADMGII